MLYLNKDCRVKPDNDIATFAKQNVGKYATAYDSFPGLTREALFYIFSNTGIFSIGVSTVIVAAPSYS